MTKKEQQQMRRLEIENQELREMNAKHMGVYSNQLIEIIELKATIELIQEALNAG